MTPGFSFRQRKCSILREKKHTHTQSGRGAWEWAPLARRHLPVPNRAPELAQSCSVGGKTRPGR